MKAKAQWVHVGLLAVSAIVALTVWTRDEKAELAQKSSEVEIWSGNPESITLVTFESTSRKVRLEAHQEGKDHWFVGSVEKEEPAFVHPPGGGPDGGAAPNPPKRETVHFFGVKAADDLVKTLAPLKALRAVGKIEGTRNEEFGFDKPEGTLKVTLGGQEQSLVIGAATPGGGERYAKSKTGDVFAIQGDLVQGMQYAESRLAEHELHAFKSEEVTRVKVSKSGKTRELVRVPNKNEGWADAATPGTLDETSGNWMTKVSRLRATDWVEKPNGPVAATDSLVHVEFFAGSKALGSLDLFKVPAEKGNDYFAKTEYGRWFAKLATTSGEQVDQDSASVVK